jgi:hypothetical protein
VGAKGEAWTRLSAQIAAVALVGSAHGSAAASAAGGAAQGALAGATAGANAGSAVGLAPLALKVFGSKLALSLLVAGSAVGASAAWLHFHESPAPMAARPQLAPPPAPPPPPEGAAELTSPPPESFEQLPEVAPLRAPAADGKPVSEQTRKDRLSAESALLTRARAELRNGNAAAAQQSLNRLRANFPHGVLGQEREVLTIEVLAARGNAEAARRRAQAFIAAYPKSPHNAQLSRFADTP